MSHLTRPVFAVSCLALALLASAPAPVQATELMPSAQSEKSVTSTETLHWFQTHEQALMDSIAKGDKSVWNQAMDSSCVITGEEGEVLDKKTFLEGLRPFPQGLTGGITVQELTVAEYPGFAVVRYLADEWEQVFGQRLATKYRMTNTYRSEGSTWKMVGSHTSVVTQDPPAQTVSSAATAAWSKFVGTYRILPDGWTFTVELRDGKLYGGRDPKKLKAFVPLTPDAFVLSGSLGEWIFVSDASGRVTHILDFRKFEPLIWTRVGAAPSAH